jgi:hypothetical protein
MAFAGNPVTSVRINRDGLRGADLPPPRDAEIVVVGDSQVFGLGVEEHETASAELARVLGGAPVINAGVPTYGPPEYNAVVEDLLAKRPVKTVIYVVNLVNDLFEASSPNVERHAVWDGWAVRKETAPESIRAFPGRELLFGRSHLVYALRSYLHARGPALDDRGFASEGTVADLVGAARRAEGERARAAREAAEKKAQLDAAIADAGKMELDADLALENAVLDSLGLRPYESGIAYQQSRNNPGDIVLTKEVYAEESRDPPRTARILFHGAELRREMEQCIRYFVDLVEAREKGAPAPPPKPTFKWAPCSWVADGYDTADAVKRGRQHPVVRSFEEREAWRKRLDELRRAPAEIVRAWSPMTPVLRQVKAACDARGALLLVVALPMDLQVSPAEWRKYGVTSPVEMEPTRILLEDLVASAEALGALALDATPALAAAEPGAFLDGDIHMTPKGHRALAEAIAAKLRSTP